MGAFSRVMLALGLAAGGLSIWSASSRAAERATATSNVNLRAGPGTNYEAIGVVPAGDIVSVFSCRSGYSWCDVDHRGKRGYLAGKYLAYASQGAYYGEPFSSVGVFLGLPLFWDDYPIYGPPVYRPPVHLPPGQRPPNWRPPDNRPPEWRPPPARPSHPIYRPPSFQRPSSGGGGFRGGGGGRGGRR